MKGRVVGATGAATAKWSRLAQANGARPTGGRTRAKVTFVHRHDCSSRNSQCFPDVVEEANSKAREGPHQDRRSRQGWSGGRSSERIERPLMARMHRDAEEIGPRPRWRGRRAAGRRTATRKAPAAKHGDEEQSQVRTAAEDPARPRPGRVVPLIP